MTAEGDDGSSLAQRRSSHDTTARSPSRSGTQPAPSLLRVDLVPTGTEKEADVDVDGTEMITPGRRLTQLAAQRADDTALAFARLDGSVERLTWADLESRANRLARRLADGGVTPESFVAIGLPNGTAHVVAAQAAWKLGACAMPLSANLPAAERDRLLDLARPAAIVADWHDHDGIGSADIAALEGPDAPPEDDPVPAPFKAVASGGSTGAPKLIVSPGAFAYPDAQHPLAGLVGLADRSVVLSPGPLYHNQPFLVTALSLYSGATAVVCERFRPELTLDLVQRLGVTYLNLVPTMMGRMLRVEGVDRYDLSSVETLLHMAAPCPEWVKRGWIDLLGPEAVFELWAATELTGITLIRGDEWLAHPGSVGKPVATELRILDESGEALPPGEIGEIHSRLLLGDGPSYDYLGADPLPEVDGGLASVGDLGHLDEDGYLYIADRRTDLIISGGANVFPAEVEEALSAHPGVADVVVVGLADDDLGERVHAIVQASDPNSPPSVEELEASCRERLAAYKRPRSFEFVESLPRKESGKIHRGALRDARETSTAGGGTA